MCEVMKEPNSPVKLYTGVHHQLPTSYAAPTDLTILLRKERRKFPIATSPGAREDDERGDAHPT